MTPRASRARVAPRAFAVASAFGALQFVPRGVTITPVHRKLTVRADDVKLLVAISIAAILAASAQALDPQRAITQYTHRSWRLDDGLPNSTVRGIVQTSDRYIWLATYDGLARYNGDSFTRFENSNLPGLERNTLDAPP